MKTNWKKFVALFITSQSISLFGSSLVQYAMSWHVTLTTQSGAMMTIAIICGFLPTFFISPFAGVWADKYNRKTIIILADGAIALTTLVIALLFMTGRRDLWLIFLTMAIRGVGQAIQQPAVSAVIPQIAPEDKLMKVNATNSMVQSALFLVSPMVAGLLLSLTSIDKIFFIDVVTALIAIVILALFVPVQKRASEGAQEAGGYFHDLRLGLTYIIHHPFVKQLFAFCTVFFLMMGPVAFLSPLQVTRLFGSEPWRLTAIEVTFSAGMIVGGGLMMSKGGFKNRHTTMTAAFVAFSAGSVVLGLFPNFIAYNIIMVAMGLTIPFFNTPFTVILQEKIEADYLGRIFGFFSMLSSIGMPVGILIFGPLSDVIDLNWIFIGTGAFMLVTSVVMGFNKALQQAGEPLPPAKAIAEDTA